jgi:hypothetical protein
MKVLRTYSDIQYGQPLARCYQSHLILAEWRRRISRWHAYLHRGSAAAAEHLRWDIKYMSTGGEIAPQTPAAIALLCRGSHSSIFLVHVGHYVPPSARGLQRTTRALQRTAVQHERLTVPGTPKSRTTQTLNPHEARHVLPAIPPARPSAPQEHCRPRRVQLIRQALDTHVNLTLIFRNFTTAKALLDQN